MEGKVDTRPVRTKRGGGSQTFDTETIVSVPGTGRSFGPTGGRSPRVSGRRQGRPQTLRTSILSLRRAGTTWYVKVSGVAGVVCEDGTQTSPVCT